jgi:hypothetical protein
MSLINDALKRAKEAQRKNPPPGAPPLTPYNARENERDLSWVLPVLIIFLIIVAFFFIVLAFAHHAVRKIVNAPDAAATQQVETVVAPAPPPPVIGPAALTNGNRPPATRVQGIFYDPVHPCAIISGRTVYLGDDVDGMRVTAIARNSITLVGKGQTNTLVVGQ